MNLYLVIMLASLALILATSLSTRLPSPKEQKQVRIQAVIMHRNAKGSPFHNPNATEHEIREEDFLIGKHRAENTQRMSINAEQADVAIVDSSFIMKFKIGTPVIETYGYLDTGSSLSWIQCLPCTKCYTQKGAMYYNREDSSSFEYVTEDNNPLCRTNALWAPIITTGDRCCYTLQYRDKTISAGLLATETLVFENDYAVNNVVIGCSYDNQRRDFSPPGLVGLGRYSVSLVNQLSYSHFSYFLHYSESSDDMIGVINLGSPPNADMNNKIPFLYSTSSSAYLLDLLSIDVLEGGSVDVSGKGIIIDTGSTYTHLESSVYDKLTDVLKDKLGDPLSSGSGEICYEDARAAGITFRFKNYDLYICDGNTWYRNPFGRYCLAIQRNEGSSSILGMYQQRGLQVDIDLDEEYVNMDFFGHQCQRLDYD